MNSLGGIASILWICSPPIMWIFKLFGWDPFTDLPWYWITFTWWWTLLTMITAIIVHIVWKGLDKLEQDKALETLNNDLDQMH